MAAARSTAAHVEALAAVEAQTERTFSRMEQLTERTAEKMQDNFSNVFYDAVTGELKSFGDYAEAIFKSIARAWSDMMGQMVAQQMFGQDFQGGGWLSMLGGLIRAGGMNTGAPVHSGARAAATSCTPTSSSCRRASWAGAATPTLPCTSMPWTPRAYKNCWSTTRG